jgi:tetratricopeptide (TPR) repeat protein
MYFFEIGNRQKATDLLMEAAELSNGEKDQLRTVGYIFEKWHYYPDAIRVYQSILSKFPLDIEIKRDLSFAYLANKNYQQALDILYQAITAENENWYNTCLKETALADLNSIAVIYADKLDLSGINPNLIRPLPVDLRITLEGNYYSCSNISITEPGNISCTMEQSTTIHGGNLLQPGYVNSYLPLKEYTIKNALKGKYQISVDAYNFYPRGSNMIRLMIFKNFQKKDQSIETEIISMDNQNGKVEIAEVTWK